MQMSNTTMQLANRLWVFTYNNYQCGEFEHNPIERGHAMHMEQPTYRLLTLSGSKDIFLPINSALFAVLQLQDCRNFYRIELFISSRDILGLRM